MTGGAGERTLRRAVWWSVGSRVSLVLALALCASAGIRVASPVRLALELTTALPLLTLAAGLARPSPPTPNAAPRGKPAAP